MFNYTDKPYTEIPVHIHIEAEPGDTLRLIENAVLGNSGLEESIKTIKTTTVSPNGELNLSYLISVGNVADSIGNFIFDANLTVLCKTKPNIKIGIDKDGLHLTEFERSHFYKQKWWENDIILSFMIIMMYIVIIVVLVKIIKMFQKKSDKRWNKYLKKHMSEKIEKGEITLNAESIITARDQISDRFNYEDSWQITRLLKGIKRPEGYHEEDEI